jgi:hypothetical protein
LNWRGATYTTASGTFFGDPVAIPGDLSQRTLNVRNDGPCGGILTVEIDNAVTIVPEGAVNREAEDLVVMRWDVAGTRGGEVFSGIVARQPVTLATIPLAQGETAPVTLGYEFPFEATTGKSLGMPSIELTFGVTLVLRGDDCPSLNPDVRGTEIAASTSPRGPARGGEDDARGRHADTGSRIAGVALPVAAILLVTGAFLAAARRRRDE